MIEVFLFLICVMQIIIIVYNYQLNQNIVILNENLIKISKHFMEGWRNI